MRLSDFDFDLPEGRIATRPARPRSSARLLVARGDLLEDRVVRDLPEILRPGDRLVLNDTKVIPARLSGLRRRPGGGAAVRIDVTLLAAQADGSWEALARPLRRLRAGDRLDFGAGLLATVAAAGAGRARLAFDLAGAAFEAALNAAGAMPLPPYIERLRKPDAADREDYQTIWARRPGAVAAPTASLHFDAPLLAALAARGVGFTHVTLHVGAGTFLPVTAEDISAHRMHAEWGEVTPEAAAELNAARTAGGRIIPVGTTALRLLETAADPGGVLHPFRGETDIFITPGWRFRATDALMTNFHLPKSTLIMLVAALMGLGRTRAIYAHAVAAGYRFFSYGDASLLFPAGADGA
jgi:S-adenosylmethionine:tRNA ribosyltransferase-isomerase